MPTTAAHRRSRPSASDDSLTTYLREIGTYPLLSRDEETALARRIHRGDAAALQQLVCANLRFVVSVAKQYHTRDVPLADLIDEGNLGLIRAAEKFDEAKGVRFISYAVWWIRQSIHQAIAHQSYAMRVPPAARAGMRAALSLDAPLSPGANAKLLDFLADEDSPAPDAGIGDPDLSASAAAALSRLRGREATVLRLYFGFDGKEPITLEAIGELLGVTRERARQIKEHALSKLRKAAASQTLTSFTTDDATAGNP